MRAFFALETLLVAVLLVAINEFSGQQQQLQCVAFGNQLVAFQSKRLRFFVNRFYGFLERYGTQSIGSEFVVRRLQRKKLLPHLHHYRARFERSESCLHPFDVGHGRT